MVYTIFDAAKWFLDKNGGSISPKKMQKLCYYAQAWSYAIRGDALFKGKFRAGVHGPVNRKLWMAFREISYRDITSRDFDALEIKFNPFKKKKAAFLKRIWATYGHLTGYQLEVLSQSEEPWMEQRQGLHPYEKSSNIINPITMAKYYKQIYKK